MDDLTAAKIIIRCLDLTSLNDTDDDEVITDICRRAVTPYGNTAAVCIYQKFIPLALQLISQNIKIATVVNFPHGGTDFAKVEAEIAKAVKAGADEIDTVFPYRSFWTETFKPVSISSLWLAKTAAKTDRSKSFWKPGS